ncbi:hypothetical protein BN1013_02171 [Candidatus Rubidus massiliensis]|nr:hypothetical protein BN1013_02171 [Candidatus Rubidus massiliensis]
MKKILLVFFALSLYLPLDAIESKIFLHKENDKEILYFQEGDRMEALIEDSSITHPLLYKDKDDQTLIYGFKDNELFCLLKDEINDSWKATDPYDYIDENLRDWFENGHSEDDHELEQNKDALISNINKYMQLIGVLNFRARNLLNTFANVRLKGIRFDWQLTSGAGVLPNFYQLKVTKFANPPVAPIVVNDVPGVVNDNYFLPNVNILGTAELTPFYFDGAGRGPTSFTVILPRRP